jgi:hypothetical protein
MNYLKQIKQPVINSTAELKGSLSFQEELQKLKSIKNNIIEVAQKKKIIARWQNYIEEGIKNEEAKNSILAQLIVWYADIGDIQGFLSLCERTEKFKLSQPESWVRSMIEIKYDEFIEWANKQNVKEISNHFNSVFPDSDLSFMELLTDKKLVTYFKLRFEIALANNDYDLMLALFDSTTNVGLNIPIKTKLEKYCKDNSPKIGDKYKECLANFNKALAFLSDLK